MDFDLKGKIALVTGSTEGIGFASAKMLAQEGATVYVNGRSSEKVKAACERIKAAGITGEVKPAPFDLSGRKGMEELTKAIPHLDILVNNVGIYEIKPFEEIPDEDWLRLFEVNVMSGVRLSRHYFSGMKKKNWGRILFISSESGVNIPVEMIHYGMTKAAQLAISRGLAEMTAGTGITVNSILPGPTYSEGVEKFIHQFATSKGISKEDFEKDFFKTVRPSSLIKRFATPDEVAALVAFVCSKQAAAVNGAALRVEGGIVRSIV